jgi:hypothetical protein
MTATVKLLNSPDNHNYLQLLIFTQGTELELSPRQELFT